MDGRGRLWLLHAALSVVLLHARGQEAGDGQRSKAAHGNGGWEVSGTNQALLGCRRLECALRSLSVLSCCVAGWPESTESDSTICFRRLLDFFDRGLPILVFSESTINEVHPNPALGFLLRLKRISGKQ